MIIIDGVDMVDISEAATLARRTPETIRRWVWSSRLPAVKQGNKLLVPRAEVLAIGGVAPVGAGSGEPPVTLSAWADEVDRTLTGGTGGLSARDLVLGDRAART